jgi:hypothetical protein
VTASVVGELSCGCSAHAIQLCLEVKWILKHETVYLGALDTPLDNKTLLDGRWIRSGLLEAKSCELRITHDFDDDHMRCLLICFYEEFDCCTYSARDFCTFFALRVSRPEVTVGSGRPVGKTDPAVGLFQKRMPIEHHLFRQFLLHIIQRSPRKFGSRPAQGPGE